MTPSEAERSAILFHLGIGPSPKHPDAPNKEMEFVLKRLKQMTEKDKASWIMSPRLKAAEQEDDDATENMPDDSNVLLLSDINTSSSGNTTLLFSYGDIEGTNPALLNVNTHQARIIEKANHEANAYSNHLVIGKEESGAKRGLYRCALERMPHLGRGQLLTFMNRLLRIHEKEIEHLFFWDSETRKQKRFHPKLSSSLQLSSKLKEDIENGTLTHIEFSTRKDLEQIDEDLQIEVQRKVLKTKVESETRSTSRVLERVNRLKNWAKRNGYEEMQLHIRSENLPNSSPRIATDLEDAADAIYSKLEIMDNFSEPLEQCYPKVHNEIESKLTALISDDIHWR